MLLSNFFSHNVSMKTSKAWKVWRSLYNNFPVNSENRQLFSVERFRVCKSKTVSGYENFPRNLIRFYFSQTRNLSTENSCLFSELAD